MSRKVSIYCRCGAYISGEVAEEMLPHAERVKRRFISIHRTHGLIHRSQWLKLVRQGETVKLKDTAIQ